MSPHRGPRSVLADTVEIQGRFELLQGRAVAGHRSDGSRAERESSKEDGKPGSGLTLRERMRGELQRSIHGTQHQLNSNLDQGALTLILVRGSPQRFGETSERSNSNSEEASSIRSAENRSKNFFEASATLKTHG